MIELKHKGKKAEPVIFRMHKKGGAIIALLPLRPGDVRDQCMAITENGHRMSVKPKDVIKATYPVNERDYELMRWELWQAGWCLFVQDHWKPEYDRKRLTAWERQRAEEESV